MSQPVSVGLPAVRETRSPTRVGRTYFIRTFGCQMNEHDTERIAGLLEQDGMVPAADETDADLVMLNTCCIRENADNKLYGNLGQLKPVKDARPGMQIVVGGCLAQKDRDVVQSKAPWVDVVFGTHNLHRVLTLLDHAAEWGPVTEIWEETRSIDEVPSVLPSHREVPHSAWVTITIGCNNSCTFCIVPIVRGKEISRRPSDILSEIRGLVADGVLEVTLLGQNVNSYGRDLEMNGRRPLFADLLRQAGAIEGVRRIRYTSPHPKDIREDVIEAMAETPAVCEQLHLPLQSGSDRILSAMHRGYTGRRFLDKLAMARDLIPGLAVSTDIIVGFPGETESDFSATLDLVAEARFDSAFMFIYSPRPGTPAAGMDGQIDREVAQERFGRLAALQKQISLERNQELVGRTVEVFTEGPSKKNPAFATARTRTNKVIHMPGDYPTGLFLDVAVTHAAPHHLMGRSLVPA